MDFDDLQIRPELELQTRGSITRRVRVQSGSVDRSVAAFDMIGAFFLAMHRDNSDGGPLMLGELTTFYAEDEPGKVKRTSEMIAACSFRPKMRALLDGAIERAVI